MITEAHKPFNPPLFDLPEVKGHRLTTLSDLTPYLFQHKKGPYLTPEDLSNLHLDTLGWRKSPIEAALHSIKIDLEKNKENALSHLCLPTKIKNALFRGGIKTISNLRSILEDDSIRIDYIGPPSINIIKQNLGFFDQKLKEAKHQSQQTFQKK